MTNPPPHGFRTFLIIWATQAVSVFGSALTFFAITIWLAQTLYGRPDQQPQLAFALAAVGLAFALPQVFTAPLAGAWVDRHDRKYTMMLSDAVSGLTSLALLLLMLSGMLNLAVLVLLIFIQGAANAFHYAAFDTSYVMLVPKEQLPRANGMMQTIWALSGILSPALAASIIALPALARQGLLPGGLGAILAPLSDGAPLAIALDVVSFFFAAGALLFLHVPSPQRADMQTGEGAKTSFWADVREGGVYIWRRRTLLWLIGTFAVANMAGPGMVVLLPLLVKLNLASDWTARGFSYETALALFNSLASVGGLIGGVLISTWGGLKRLRVYGILVPMVLCAVGQTLIGLSPWLYLSAALLAFNQSMIPIMNSHSQAIWQTQVPPELQGRVFAVRRVIGQSTYPLATALMGFFGGWFNPGSVIAVLGGLMTVFMLLQFFNPWLLRVEDKEGLDRQAAAAS